MPGWGISLISPLLVYWCWVASWKHPRFLCWLLMFADWVHHVCDTCNRCTAKSSLLFSSWIICWLALKIYLDTGDSITGKTSKDLPKYNCVYTCRTKWGWFLFPEFPLWALEPGSFLWHSQGDKGVAFPWPRCRSHIALQPKKSPFSSPVLFVPSCPKKPAGNERAIPSCLPAHVGPEDPNPVCAQLILKIWTCSTWRGNHLWTDKLQMISTDFCSKVCSFC